MPKKIIEWHIFKKTHGVTWPGESWDYFKSERKARKKFKEMYDPDNFRLVRIILEST